MGQLSSLRVLDVCGNRLHCLPLSISNLDLDAFWISGNQVRGEREGGREGGREGEREGGRERGREGERER